MFYARRLNITPKYLSTVSKDVSGKTAARWIDEAVILEAKSLLRYSGMSIQEIAYHLNFSTQSFFGKYFNSTRATARRGSSARAADGPRHPGIKKGRVKSRNSAHPFSGM